MCPLERNKRGFRTVESIDCGGTNKPRAWFLHSDSCSRNSAGCKLGKGNMKTLRTARNLGALIILAMALVTSHQARASQYTPYACQYKKGWNCMPNLLSGKCSSSTCKPGQVCSNSRCAH